VSKRDEAPPVQLSLDFRVQEDAIDEILPLLSPHDIYDRATELLTVLREDRRIERKPPGIHLEPIGEYFCMWANTAPDGGLIAVGIDDDGGITGCKLLTTEKLNELEAVGDVRCQQARYVSKRVAVTNKAGEADFILLFHVFYHPTRLVETCNHKVFVRLGDKKKEVKSDEEKRQLRVDKGEIQYEQEPARLAYPDKFDRDLIEAFADQVRTVRNLRRETTTEHILAALRLGKLSDGDFSPNIACALAFAKDPVEVIPGCRIHFLQYADVEAKGGKQFNEVANIPPIEGPLPRQIARINDLLSHRISTMSWFGSDGKFRTTPEYPPEAWQEAVVNAVVHRSYIYKNMKVFVRMFPDRLEIESPGPFPPGVTPESIYYVQHSRNPHLMEVMRYLGYVREIGEGAPRMRDSMKKLELPAPEFKEAHPDAPTVKVTLRNDAQNRRKTSRQALGSIIGESLIEKLSKGELQIVDAIVARGSLSVSEASRITGHNWPTSRKLLMGLVERGILQYVHRKGMKVDRKAHFIFVHKGLAKT